MATPCGTNTLPSLLERGGVDAVALWEPSTQLAADAIGSDAIVFQDRSLYREIVNLHSTAEKLADPEKRRGIVEFVRALSQPQELYRISPEAVWPRISNAIGIEPSWRVNGCRDRGDQERRGRWPRLVKNRRR